MSRGVRGDDIVKSDEDIKREVEAELNAHPSFDRGDVIAVAVKEIAIVNP